MDNKQLGNKRESFSIRKYSIGTASILVGSLLFLGGGEALAAESNESNTSEKVPMEQTQSAQEQPSHEASTERVEQPQNKAIATQETKTNEDASSEETQSNEADTESNEVIHNDTQSNETSEQSTAEPKTQQNKASDDVTTQEVTSTEQPTQEKTQSTSKQEVTTQETSTTEVQPKNEQSQTEEQPQHETKETYSQSNTQEAPTKETKKPTQPTTENKQSEKSNTTQQTNQKANSEVSQSNVTSTEEVTNTNETRTRTQPFSKEEMNKVTATEESDVAVSDVPQTQMKYMSTKQKQVLFNTLQRDANTQDQQPKAILSTIPEWTSAQRTKNASRTGQDQLNITHKGRYTSGADFGNGGTEIVKYNPKNGYAYSVNGDKEALDIIDVKHPGKDGAINLVKRIYLQDNGIEAGDLTSVTVHPSGDYVAVSAPAVDKTKPGHVVFYGSNGDYINNVTVGSLPDMVTFSKDSKYLLVANEGEPSDDYTVNPPGSVSVIDVTGGPANVTANNVRTAMFTKEHQEGIRALGPNAEDAYLNIEPEYIAVDSQSKYAYVTLQEVSAIAKVDIVKGQIVQVKGLPYKDHSLAQNAMDVSDEDGKSELRRVPVLGLLQPDGIDTYDYNGETYLLIANEGDSQDYEGYSEEKRVKKLKDDIQLDARYYQGYTQAELDDMVDNGLFDDEQLGRLKVTTSHAFKDADGKYNALVSYGGRSFSILRASDLEMIYDSGSDIEQRVLDLLPERFNANYESADDIKVDDRSDDKGPEAENVVVGKVGSHSYAFVGLERVGGIMIYDITNPNEPYFVKYLYDLDNKDISPEGITFESAEESPNGKPMLIASFELSGTTSAWELEDLTGDQESDDGEDSDNPGNTNGESNDDDTTPNPPSENDGSNTDHDVDNGEQPDNGDDTSSNDEDNHSSDDTNGNDEGLEPPYEVDGDIFEDDSDEVISDKEDNNDTSAQSHEEVESKGASHNINHSAHANHQEESRDKLTVNSNTHNLSVVSTKSSSHHAVTTNHGSVVSDKSNHANTSSDNVKKELPKSGQTETNTTLWSVLLGGLGLAFIRKRKASKSEK
ncbi:choice-of-anchor I family protein [Staphylococcus sp. EG-SA-6]|uniref:YSIRK Gram-positive signal peptide domain-containing protein n=8 Tax=Bacilli TaxID=91061 RepID=A0A7Z1N6L6_STAHA|nr:MULTISPECIES: choice-of-anchor I family protein [Staphylococcus]KDP47790.1 Gram-positive signal peptide protein, YSIRK family [Staphylococcus aureus subsp. aureus CO-98]MBN4935368.1 choice-of-anchor I family protein [Staphylococcus sp. EG-SA-6]AYX84148.1 YSIRK-type signal peptide-containing protein [Staphylococcus haemolyticus]MBK3924358.1 choice-of-anchor I family protein [Staphylococcus haemolyticus]MBK3933920.1 choice-of-anchor I family protein [Staphylococcus haemolyticus]